MRKNVSPLPNWCSDSACHIVSHRLMHLSSLALLHSLLMHLYTWIMKWTSGCGAVASCAVNPLCPHGGSTCWPILLCPTSGQCVGEKLLHFKRITSYSDSTVVRCESHNHLKYHPSWVSETLRGERQACKRQAWKCEWRASCSWLNRNASLGERNQLPS